MKELGLSDRAVLTATTGNFEDELKLAGATTLTVRPKFLVQLTTTYHLGVLITVLIIGQDDTIDSVDHVGDSVAQSAVRYNGKLDALLRAGWPILARIKCSRVGRIRDGQREAKRTQAKQYNL